MSNIVVVERTPTLYKTERLINPLFKPHPIKIPKGNLRKLKRYPVTFKDLATGEQITPVLTEGSHVGRTIDLFCCDLMSEQFFFYRNKLLSLEFLTNSAKVVFESGIFHDDIPVIEFGPKVVFWFRALYCESVSLVVKIASCTKKKPIGYQPLINVPTEKN